MGLKPEDFYGRRCEHEPPCGDVPDTWPLAAVPDEQENIAVAGRDR